MNQSGFQVKRADRRKRDIAVAGLRQVNNPWPALGHMWTMQSHPDATSRRLARLIGPIIAVLAPTEAFNMSIFADQIAPVVYLNGLILFAAGIAILEYHNRWVWRWPVLVTLVGWALLLAGFWRMAAPRAPQAPDDPATTIMLAGLTLVGLFLTFQGYLRRPQPTS